LQQAAYDKNGVYLPTDQYQEMLSDQEERTTQLADAKQKAEAVELKHVTLTAEFEQNMTMLLAREEDLKVARQEAVQLQIALNEMNEQLIVIARQIQEEKYVSESYMRGEQRLNEIAVDLKATVNESVKDVGGLFQKIGESSANTFSFRYIAQPTLQIRIARKNDVLNANTGAAAAYGTKLNGLADQLHQDIEAFKSVHTDFGSMLNEELVSFAARNAESLEKDKAYLETQLESFGQAIQRSKSEFEAQHDTALGLNSEVALAQTELQQNLIAWMGEQRQMVEKAIANVENVQRTHLLEVGDNIILLTKRISITHQLCTSGR
jgi:kinesin family protein 11